MTTDYPHLTAAAADLLSAPGDKRVRAIKSRRWVLYPRAKLALDHLNRLINHPRGTRMPSIAIYGDSGRDRLKIGGQAAIAIDGDDSLVGWNVCP